MSIYRIKGTSGPVLNQSFMLQGQHRIGAAGDCDIAVEGVAGAAAELAVTDGAIVLTAVGDGEPVFLNGEPVGSAQLGSGDEIRIGPNRFIVQAPGLRPERVLTGEAVEQRRPTWPWWILAAVAAGAAALAWYQGWLPL